MVMEAVTDILSLVIGVSCLLAMLLLLSIFLYYKIKTTWCLSDPDKH